MPGNHAVRRPIDYQVRPLDWSQLLEVDQTAQRAAALLVCERASDVDEARRVLLLLGLVEAAGP